MQVKPSALRVNPGEQSQVKEPTMSMQSGVHPGRPPQVQVWVPSAHSLASERRYRHHTVTASVIRF